MLCCAERCGAVRCGAIANACRAGCPFVSRGIWALVAFWLRWWRGTRRGRVVCGFLIFTRYRAAGVGSLHDVRREHTRAGEIARESVDLLSKGNMHSGRKQAVFCRDGFILQQDSICPAPHRRSLYHPRTPIPTSNRPDPTTARTNIRDLSAVTPPPDDGKHGKTNVVSIKHTMSRVKAGGGDGGAAAASGASSGEPRVADGNRLKAALRASIESRTSSHEGAGELDEDEEEDLDSPRNRGRQYDDRWKMPGHAESVLASFVERLEHRGHAIDDDGGGGGGGGGIASGEMSAAAALEEARASRGAAVAVLGRSNRLQSERAARNSPGPSAVLAEGGKKRRSAGGGKSGGGAKNGTGSASRSRGKGGRTSTSGRRGSAGKGRTAGAAPANESGGHKRSNAGLGGGAGGAGGGGSSAGSSAGSGAWSKIASSIQRAAEAIVGVSKEDGEEEQQHRTERERTRNAVTAFLSSTRREDQE